MEITLNISEDTETFADDTPARAWPVGEYTDDTGACRTVVLLPRQHILASIHNQKTTPLPQIEARQALIRALISEAGGPVKFARATGYPVDTAKAWNIARRTPSLMVLYAVLSMRDAQRCFR